MPQFKKTYTTILMALALSCSQAVFSADALVCKGCVNNTDLGDGAVSNTKIQDGAISSGKLQDNTVSTTKIVNGSITATKLKNSAVTANKIAPGSVNSTHFAPGAVVGSLNGLKDSVSIQAGVGIGVNTSGNTLIISNTQAIPDSPVIVLDNSNLASTEIQTGGFIQLAEMVWADSFDPGATNLTINGGGFGGDTPMRLYLRNSTISNAKIKNVAIYGFNITFVNCSFEGGISIPQGSSVVGSVFQNVNASNGPIRAKINSSKILSSNLEVEWDYVITNSYILDSDIRTFGVISGNRIEKTILSVGGVFEGNSCYNCGLKLEGGNLVSIVGNTFEQQPPRTDPIITVDEISESPRRNLIANNQFAAYSTPTIIQVMGTGYWNQVIQITGNQFLQASNAIAYNGSLRTSVTGNTTAANTVLGVTDNGLTLRVLENVQF